MSAAVSLRRADARDLPFILRGERQYISAVEPDRQSTWLAGLDRTLGLWVDNLDRTLIASTPEADVGYMIWRWTRSDAELVSIYTEPALRGRGVGATLLEGFIAQAQAAGAHALVLEVHLANGAQRLYERHGFRRQRVVAPYARYVYQPPRCRHGAASGGRPSGR